MRTSLLLAAMLVSSGTAWAGGGNQDGYFLDDTASMTGGSVTATVQGGGAIWYNPAGMVKEKGHEINLTATVYSAKKYTINNFLVTEFDDRADGETGDFTEYLSAPTVLTYVRDWGKHSSVGFTVSVQRLTDLELRTQSSTAGTVNDQTYESDFGIAVTSVESTYYAGPAIAWSLAPNLRLGVSLLGFYQSERGTTTQSLSIDDNPSTPSDRFFAVVSTIGGSKYLGLRPIAGVQWAPTRSWDLGLTVRAPMMVLWGATDFDLSVSVFSADSGEGAHQITPTVDRGFTFDIIEPIRILGGVAHTFENGNRVEINTDVALPVGKNFLNESTWIINARAGGLFPIGDDVVLGTGLFTDLSGTNASEFGEIDVDYYGGTIGVELTKSYELADGGTLKFITTIGGTVQVGTGVASSAIIIPDPDGTDIQTGAGGATFVEGSLNLGLKTRF